MSPPGDAASRPSVARPESPAVRLNGITVSRGGQDALHAVTLTVAPGEFLGVLGPNGAGKTTLLTVINGLARFSAGRAEVLGVPLGRSDHSRLRRRIGYVAQEVRSDPRAPVSCREAVMLGRVGRIGLFRAPTPDDRAVVERVMAITGITALAERPVGRVSGGEARKVALARALAQEPELFLLDEPAASLDRYAAPELLGLVEDAHRRFGLTTVMVTHREEDLPGCCRRVILLRTGAVLFDGSREDALAPARLAAAWFHD